MKFRKLVSAVSVLAMSVSLFTVFTIAAEAENAVTKEDLADVWVFENIRLNNWMDNTYFYFDYKLPGRDEEITVSTYDEENPENSKTAIDFLESVTGTKFTIFSGEGKMNFALRILPDKESGAELTGIKLENRNLKMENNSINQLLIHLLQN